MNKHMDVDITNQLEAQDCPVCYTTISGKNVPLAKYFNCTHILCHRCLRSLRNELCPLCRADIQQPQTINNNIILSST